MLHNMISRVAAVAANRCAVDGCLTDTAGHYCAAHREICEECSAEVERGHLIGGACDECRRIDCAGELEDYATARCFCGHHISAAVGA